MKTSNKITTGLLGIIPGLGQIFTGRYLRGFVLFFSSLILFDLAFIIIPFLWGGTDLANISRGLVFSALIIWIYNLIDIARIVWWRERETLIQQKKPLFQSAFTCYLQNEIAGARKEFRKILQHDRDDIDALFYLGVIARQAGKTSQARRYFEKSLRRDENQKWLWEIERTLETTDEHG